MQSVILELQRFWAERGCLIWQPYYTQVGAGTMNPATFLRVLGPEPWRVAYVEPSIRPDDARYGENPNRLQQHYQFQVILKPDPGNPQEIYLQSLQAIGVDPARHDIRFVEDKWEAPALGAWGLGWEVWLDGQEITQFTYFQQAGGEPLDPVSVEITYGLERILIGMLSLEHFKDIPWNRELRYGDLLWQSEAEQSRYYLERADIDRMSGLFALHEEEARAALEHGLVLPAYDNLLRCSHLFNVLDARGAVGVTERAALFGRMRELSRIISEKYLDQRRQLEFPWLGQVETSPLAAPPAELGAPPTTPQDFLLEIGTEELPAGDLAAALTTLVERAPMLFEQHRLDHRGLRISGTPRRLIVDVAGLSPTQGEVVEMVKGPPEARAFDSSGRPTQAALGWAGKQGLESTPEALRAMVKDLEGGRYLAAQVRRGGLPTTTVLARDLLPRLIESIGFDQTMRWIGTPGDSPEAVALRRTAFARPIRWLLALHGDSIVPFSFAGLQAGRRTRSLRFVEPETLVIENPAAYRESLARQGIFIDADERRRRIVEQAKALASEVQGELDADTSLLDEVTNLAEAPNALRGDFEPSFLSLPDEVLAAVMKKHQRYFPIRGRDGKLLPHFIVVRNGGPQGLESIRAGNEHVLRARFADADFFLRKDREGNAEHFRSKTARVTFQARLGSMLDKTQRIEKLVPDIAAQILHLKGEAFDLAVRAAHLCKADLATAMVMEMTSLQGMMGRIYARLWGEPEAVAQAIYEHYLPRFAGDRVPDSPAGVAVGLADRIDTLAGLFAAGLQPTGTRDPFALRRTAIGLIEILVARGLRADLRLWLKQAGQGLPIPVSQESLESCLRFVASRHEALLLADGRRYDVVAAVLAAQGHDPAGAAQAVADLEAAVARPGWPLVLQAYARCARIVPRPASSGSREGRVEPKLFEMEAERDLMAAAEKIARPASVAELVTDLQSLVPPITEFFDKVLVMDEDPAKRANRLSLVQRVVALADGLADLSKLEGF